MKVAQRQQFTISYDDSGMIEVKCFMCHVVIYHTDITTASLWIIEHFVDCDN